MNKRAHVFGWVVAVLSLLAAWLGMALFTPAIMAFVVLLPAAVASVWLRAVLPGVLGIAACLVGIALSPIPLSDWMKFPLSIAGVLVCLFLGIFGLVWGVLTRHTRTA